LKDESRLLLSLIKDGHFGVWLALHPMGMMFMGLGIYHHDASASGAWGCTLITHGTNGQCPHFNTFPIAYCDL
jgi:hypothetical protein